MAREAISAFLLERSRDHPALDFDPASVQAVDHCYELDLPMQLIQKWCGRWLIGTSRFIRWCGGGGLERRL